VYKINGGKIGTYRCKNQIKKEINWGLKKVEKPSYKGINSKISIRLWKICCWIHAIELKKIKRITIKKC